MTDPMTTDPTRADELAALLLAVRAPHRLAKRFELDASGEPIRVAARWCECGAEMPRGLDAAQVAWEQHIAEAQATELLAATPPADANAPGLRKAVRELRDACLEAAKGDHSTKSQIRQAQAWDRVNLALDADEDARTALLLVMQPDKAEGEA